MTYQATKTEKRILATLLLNTYIGSHRTLEQSAVRCLPKSERGNGITAVQTLQKAGILQKKPVQFGNLISINPTRLPEVYEILGF